MAGNTRGKLKEHFEGVHRNFDWCIAHINKSLALIESKLRETQDCLALGDDEDAIAKYVAEYPLTKGITSLGQGIQTLDGLSQDIYKSL